MNEFSLGLSADASEEPEPTGFEILGEDGARHKLSRLADRVRGALDADELSFLVSRLSLSGASDAERARECPRCGRVFAPRSERCTACAACLTDAAVPFVLRGVFRFERRIGDGGMAVVYRARDLPLGRTVAIKTLPRMSPEHAVQLQREARTAATVSHPGLAAIHGIETWDGVPMLILELLAAGTLADRIRRRPLAPHEALETGLAVAATLDHLHSVDILHRDVKPSNIGYSQNGTIKLLDLGIARRRRRPRPSARPGGLSPRRTATADRVKRWAESDVADDATTAEQIVGTLSYLSPEALAGADPSPGFDLWSLSVVLYEALTGANLFFAPNRREVARAIRQGDIPDVRSRAPQTPEPLAELLATELSRDRRRRARTAKELHQRLQRVAAALVSRDR